MTPIISSNRFERLTLPRDIDPLINRDHRMARVLITMIFNHPRIYSRPELMKIGGFLAVDGVTEFSAFHFWMLRINDTLPRTGWRVNDNAGYRLTPVTKAHEDELRYRLNGEPTLLMVPA